MTTARIAVHPPAPYRARSSDHGVAASANADGRVAFERVYERFHGSIYGYCWGILDDRAEAEDALQETMVKAYVALRAGEQELNIKPWLYTVARNVCIDRIRRRRAHSPLEPDDEFLAVIPSAADSAEERDRLRMLVEDMRALEESERSALILRELSGLSLVEIAEILETTPPRVKALIFTARSKMRKSPSALAALTPVLPFVRSQEILARVLAHGGSGGAGIGGILAAAGAKKLVAAALLVALGAGATGVAVSSSSAPSASAADAQRLTASAAAATAHGLTLAAAVSPIPVRGAVIAGKGGGTPTGGAHPLQGPAVLGSGPGAGAPGLPPAVAGVGPAGSGGDLTRAAAGVQGEITGTLGTVDGAARSTLDQTGADVNALTSKLGLPAGVHAPLHP